MKVEAYTAAIRAAGCIITACFAITAGHAAPANEAAPCATLSVLGDAPRVMLTPEKIVPKEFRDVPNVAFKDPGHDAILSAHLEGDIAGPGLRADIETYPAGMTVAAHMHKTTERFYVIEGSLDLQLGEPGQEKTVTYPRGSYVVIPGYTRHVVSTPLGGKVLVIQLGPYIALPAAK